MTPPLTVRGVYYRGGSSKATFFRASDVPPPGAARDLLIRRVVGAGSPIQVDGMGGSRVVTSKAAIVGPSGRADADVDYTFAQVGIEDDVVGYGQCGNISAAVGPFAISEGMVTSVREGASFVKGLRMQEVRIYNTGTDKIMIAHVPVDQNGHVLERGDFEIAAVPGTGAPILMDYSGTIGAALGNGLLPTGHVTDTIQLGGRDVAVTVCDVGNLIVYVAASDVGLVGSEHPDAVNAAARIALLKEVRGRASHLVGRCGPDWTRVDEETPLLPMVVFVGPDDTGEGDLHARLILDNRCHESMAGTGAINLAAASRVKGSVVNKVLKEGADREGSLRVHHNLGVMPVSVVVKETGADGMPVFETLSFVRTARRIMTGELHLPWDVQEALKAEEDTESAKAANGNTDKASGTRAASGNLNGKPAENGTSATTGQNGADGAAASSESESPAGVTSQLAAFVVRTTFASIPPDVVAKLQELLLDHVGVASSAARLSESSGPFLAAVSALCPAPSSSSKGTTGSTVYGQPDRRGSFTPPYAALLNAAFAHSFDFDDTLSAAVSHPGAAVIPAALAEAEARDGGSSGRDVLTALAVGYEVSARLGRALGTGGYPRGFHNTGTAGVFGAVAAVARLRGLGEEQLEHAFGLAGSRAAGSMQFLDNGAWNKRLHPGFAAHDAFVCVALAEAGVTGAAKAIEGKYGFLHAYSDRPRLDGITDGLGHHWLFKATALKPFPACRMTHAAIDVAARVGAESRAATGASEKRGAPPPLLPRKITVRLSPSCHDIVGAPLPNKVHPRTTVDAQFSVYYQTAVAWLFGADVGWAAYDAARMADARVAALCDRVVALPDPDVHDLEARLAFEFDEPAALQDREECLRYPLGEDENPFGSDRVKAKFRGLADPVYGPNGAEQIAAAVDTLAGDSATVDTFMKLL